MAFGVPFVVRIRELAGTILPPNVHAVDENITVVEGTWYAALGDQFDSLALQALPVGSFLFVPRNTPVYGYAPAEVTLQIHGIGPLEQRYLDTLYTLIETGEDDSTVVTDPSRFHYQAGQTVHTVRGTGRIRDGYATGGLIQYELVTPNGRLFMAREGEIRPR
ncbi:MAG: cupin domain-containing protein [Gemmatimonadales bacterium]